jgi:hypothetical protein
VRLSQIADLPLAAMDPMQEVVSAGISNVAPVTVVSDTTVQYVTLTGGRRVLLVHATGAMTFDLKPEQRHLAIEYGISDGAYTNAGATDGAEFVVEAVNATGKTEIVWRRVLEPLKRSADRGTQRIDVELPPGTTRAVLRSLPGPAKNNPWDWTYWASVRFSP